MTDHDVVLMQRLHDEHADALWYFCLRLVGQDRSRAEDVVQETLLRAWRHGEILAAPAPSLRSWLYTVARNIVTDEWRHRRVINEVPVAEPPDSAVPTEENDQVLLSWMVADALTRLSPDHRAVLLECYYRGRPVAEAAERLGVPVGTVKSRTHYALRALKLALDEMGVSA